MKELVERFRNNIDVYKSSRYDEENTKIDFIDKFFGLLGWDVYNNSGASEDFREVVREDKVIIKGRPKSPDYSFKIGKERQFFVEAKKPSVNIYDDTKPAFQVRRYGYSAGLPISILTDFEEFAIYDTTIKPNENDKASVSRIFYCTFEEYEKNWDFFNDTISKQAVWQGKLKNFVKENKKKKGTQSIDKELLLLIETWREALAKNIALRNKDLDIYQLNEAVQKVIDRIIFLRMAEDRNTEVYATLQNLAKDKDIYPILVKYFDSANKKYNSGLFKPQEWLNDLTIDDKIFKTIISDIYYPMPYEFSVLPIEILGHIYEQFLGKTIRLTAGHQAKIEEKPEVRKAGGVYYTPKYIVDYIVENTVGKKIEKKTPIQISPLTILDPACGSGSFLVGAYKFLLNYHLGYWTNKNNIKKGLKEEAIFEVKQNQFSLTLKTKREILLNNIYGVDIDSQAVEVTKLSLLLTLMEDEIVEASTKLFLKNSKEAILPNLENNIKCGNSLIGSDFYDNVAMQLFDYHEQRKINCFDWKDEFKNIFENGGFDCVIGNPPYVQIQKNESKDEKDYWRKYKTFASTGDIYSLFYERGAESLKKDGLLGFITSNKWMRANYGKATRKYFAEQTIPLELIDFSGYKIFEDATVDTNILIFGKGNTKKYNLQAITINKNDDFSHKLTDYFIENAIEIEDLSEDSWIISSKEEQAIKKKIEAKGTPLKEWDISINYGIKTGFNEAFIIDGAKKDELIAKDPKSAEIIKPILRGRDIKRYAAEFADKWLIATFPAKRINIDDYPVVKEYLKEFLPKIKQTGETFTKNGKKQKTRKKTGNKWFETQDQIAYYNDFEKEKIVYPNMTKYLPFLYDEENHLTNDKCFIITSKTYNLKCLLGVLNSWVFDFAFKDYFPELQGGTRELRKVFFETLPIPQIPAEEQAPFINLVEQMLAAQKAAHSENILTDTDKKLHQQRIKILDKQIDKLVYELYDLNEEEIKIVEGE